MLVRARVSIRMLQLGRDSARAAQVSVFPIAGTDLTLAGTGLVFLELAVTGRADVIITGDRDLLALNPFRSISIITPAEFVQGGA
jgi:hypothetical protein